MEQVIESPVTSPQRTGGNAQQDVLVSVRELTKLYGTKVALSRVDLTVHAGEIVGLLGPNGAGKSTLLEILEGLKRASSGTALVLGKAPQALTVEERGHVGLVFQRYTLPRYLRVRELLHMYEVAYPYESSAGLAKTLGIAHLLNERIEHLSAGQRQRVCVFCALFGTRRIVLMDEPTSALDVRSRRATYDSILALKARGLGALIATHSMDEAVTLCDRVYILVNGEIVLHGSVAELAARRGSLEQAYLGVVDHAD